MKIFVSQCDNPLSEKDLDKFGEQYRSDEVLITFRKLACEQFLSNFKETQPAYFINDYSKDSLEED
ncbi:CLUMA_CG001178, isoform A [Clunio marinus]|uniref:CLUMA_CG001178, isoform A n=1 Tax=Clunio marinus TaxID=568069 RepID=A0A1J1HH77_9DIPT|nr:CLUMA_CG001178, isoform A [Clunio marinus]